MTLDAVRSAPLPLVAIVDRPSRVRVCAAVSAVAAAALPLLLPRMLLAAMLVNWSPVFVPLEVPLCDPERFEADRVPVKAPTPVTCSPSYWNEPMSHAEV